MSIYFYIAATITILLLSEPLETVPIRDHTGELHEYLSPPKLGNDNFCVIHNEDETIIKVVTPDIDLAKN